MKELLNKYYRQSIAVLLGLTVFLFWFCWHPEILNYQEQNQLFLFSADYFMERNSVAGGLADWISEFLVQFFYYSWLGAVVLSLVFMGLQQLLLVQFNNRKSLLSVMLSLIPVALVIWYLGDIDSLLSYVIALLLVLVANWGMKLCAFGWADILVIPLLYWMAGPMAWLYVGLRIIANGKWYFLEILYLLVIQLLCYKYIFTQYPLQQVMLGINYYRVPYISHTIQWLIPVVILLLVFISNTSIIDKTGKKAATCGSILCFILLVILSVTIGYDKDVCELLKEDMLIRHEKWGEVISRAEKYQVQSSFSSNCVNLSLGMTRQLADRMFDFYQSGEDALIMPSVRDNMSNIPSAEAFYRLGMTNSCLHYFSDLQESILNFRKSGRFTQRIIECMIVNGNYRNAQKHIDLLKQSLFYRSWALDAESYLGNEGKIDNHPVWGKMRRYHFKHEFLYSYPEIDKMFGQLFADNTDNKMALDYFMGDMLLKGNVQGFVQYMKWVQYYGGYMSMPMGYQSAMQTIQSGGQAPGRYSDYVKRMMINN